MKVYQEQNVYDACVERINIVFDKYIHFQCMYFRVSYEFR